jgi:DNA polymerase-1
MKELYLLDGYGLIYRSYYAFSGRPLNNARGENIAAVLAFYRSVFSFLKEKQPANFLVVLDSIEKNFRFDLYPEYKANRQKAPEDLHTQTAVIEEILAALDIKTLRISGYEADDVIATIATRRRENNLKTFIVSSDKDLMQLIDSSVLMLRPNSKNGFDLYDAQKVYEEKSVRPHQIGDYLAIIGDSSDNIPGVAGLGPKAAEKLFAAYQSLDEIYEHINEITPPGVRSKLEAGKEMAYLSRQLTELCCDAPIGDILEQNLSVKNLNYQQAAEIFNTVGIPSLASACLKEAGGNPAPASSSATRRTPPEGKTEAETETPPRLSSYASSDHLRYRLINTKEELTAWAAEAAQAPFLAFDSETTSLDSNTAEAVGFSFAFKENEAVYIPVKASEKLGFTADEVKSVIKPLLENPQVKIIGQNLKYDYKIMKRWGIIFKPYFDTMLAAWLIDSESMVNMDFLAERYLAYKTIHFEELVAKNNTFDMVPLKEAALYAAEDADITLKLYYKLKPLIEEKKLTLVLYGLEVPLITILADMELTGIRLNQEKLTEFGKELNRNLAALEENIHQLAGIPFNLQSPKQLGEVLFDKMGLPTLKKRSTDVTVLEELAKEYEIAAKMLEYRTLIKLKTTYVETLQKQCDAGSRVHTDFIQTGAATGRLASRNPNLQNIPVREEIGRRIRTAFESAEGDILISADYSQIELVALAYLAQDETMLEVFTSGGDLHRETAAYIYHITPEEVTGWQRSVAKTINFGVIYGMSAFRLSNELKIPRLEAAGYIESYFKKYHKIKSFMHEIILKAEEAGGVYTVLGRFRPIPKINSRNGNERSAAERAAVNTVVQGSAADIVKLAMIRLEDRLRQEQLQSRILLQVHDEIIIEAPLAEKEKAGRILHDIMEKVPTELPVPMKIKVNIEEGRSWGEFH